ncbi:MAG: site-2 protease family protein [Candidatus Obscuribacterales bacterium]|nr:site-2 protease family protein [Candidatus Obscuribacterales bacterium]
MKLKIWKYEISPFLLIVAPLCYLILILGHECGHWLVAKLVGFHAPVFRIGHGVQQYSLFTIGGTQFVLSPLLIGGGVQVNELMAENLLMPQSRNLLIGRLAVLAAGPVASLFIALVLGTLITGGNARLLESQRLCRSFSGDIVRALIALATFGNMRTNNDKADYLTFFEIPFAAFSSWSLCSRILFSTALSEFILNILPLPMVDGGKMLFDLLTLIGAPLSADTKEIAVVLSGLFLIVVFFGALYRSFRWPIPK